MSKIKISLFAFFFALFISSPAFANGAPPQRVTAVWSNSQHLDLFMVDTNGHVVSTWWESGCDWQPWFPIHPESGSAIPGQPVTAVWSNPQHLDLFITNVNGEIISTWWEGGKGWQPWFGIHSESGRAKPGQAVTAVWSNPRHLDLFITNVNGEIRSTWWEGNKNWQPWFPIHTESGKAAPGQTVTAVWSNPQHLDLFITNANGEVMSTWWEGNKNWQPWFPIHPESGRAKPGQAITAVWSNPKHLDLFMCNQAGQVVSTWWEGNKNWQPWFPIHPESGTASAGQPVTAVWSNPQHLDLFISDRSGRVISTWWEGSKNWQPWFPIHPETGNTVPDQQVSAVWSNPQHLDLFITGRQGEVLSTWWEGNKNWQPWFSIYPDTAMARIYDPHNVLTQLNNNARTGAYLSETTLTPDSVHSEKFQKLYQRRVEGQILAQPLYVKNVDTKQFGRRNLILVETAANMIYAFDADDQNPNPDAGWVFRKKLHESFSLSAAKNNTKVDVCTETYPPYIGVSSTPVVDPASQTMYVVEFSSVEGKDFIHALDLQDELKDKVPAVEVTPPPNQISDSEKPFGLHERNRPGLLMVDQVVYVAFAGFICDHPLPYAGWVLGYRSRDLKPISAWRTPGSLNGGGIWQSGRGLVGEPDGSIYFMTGNDNAVNPGINTLANSFVKLKGSCNAGLVQQANFTSANTVNLSKGDTDLGSSGPILLPGNRLVGGGKQGRVYVLNTQDMKLTQDQLASDRLQGFAGFVNTYHNDASRQACTNLTIKDGSVTRTAPDGGNPDKYCRDPNSIQIGKPGFQWTAACTYSPDCYLPSVCYQFCQAYGPNLHAGFVYWPAAPDHGWLYAMPEKDYLRKFRYDLGTRHVSENAVQNSSFRVPDGMPGAALAISANNTNNGIIWASMASAEDATAGVHRGSLVAADANDLNVLWRDDCVQYFAKFNPPIIADGKVVLATFADPSRLAIPGQNCTAPPPPIPSDPSQLNVGTAWLIVYGVKQ